MKKLDERIKDARCPDCGSPSVSHPSDDPVVWCRDMSNGQRHGWIKSLLDAVLAVGEDSMGEDGRNDEPKRRPQPDCCQQRRMGRSVLPALSCLRNHKRAQSPLVG